MVVVNSRLSTLPRTQKTLKKEVTFSGIGIHTGQCVSMKFCPAKEGEGIFFKRIDLPNHPIIPASIEYVCDTARSTTIGIGDVRVHTIEHVLAALSSYGIDNLCIELSNLEPPVADGSSLEFVRMIEEAGIQEQTGTVAVVKIDQPVYWSEKGIHLVALPFDGYRISYTLNYPDTPALKSQFQSFDITPSVFKEQISPCRTFSLYKEVSIMMDHGLIKGGSLDNAVVIKDDVIFSKGGLRFSDEMVRHKILDMVGDLSLIGFNIHAHFIAICSGHAANFAFSKKIFQYITEKC